MQGTLASGQIRSESPRTAGTDPGGSPPRTAGNDTHRSAENDGTTQEDTLIQQSGCAEAALVSAKASASFGPG